MAVAPSDVFVVAVAPSNVVVEVGAVASSNVAVGAVAPSDVVIIVAPCHVVGIGVAQYVSCYYYSYAIL